MRYLEKYEFFKINEEVSKQPLYHYTTLSNLYSILKSDKMIARSVGDSTFREWRNISDKSISFCRKYLTIDQLIGIQDGADEPIRIIIHFDYEKLNQRYKFVPWSDSRSKSPKINNSQFEERCTSDIEDVKKYIIRIEVIYDDIITGISFNESGLKNDDIGLSSGKDNSRDNLPWEEFVSSEFFKKSLYSLLSLDKELKRNFSEIFNSINTNTGKSKSGYLGGNVILGSILLICLWNWWVFNKIRKLASGIKFDFPPPGEKVRNNRLNGIKLSSSSQDLIKSLISDKDRLLGNFSSLYEEQINQISRSEDFSKKYEKDRLKEKSEKEEKAQQEIRDKVNLKKWREQADIKKRREIEDLNKKEREARKRLGSKLNSELVKDESYLGIVRWVKSNMDSSIFDESNVSDFFSYLIISGYRIKDSNVSSVVEDNSAEIYKLINNCKNFDETIEKCKELMMSIKKSLDTFKPSTFNKIKKFFNID